MNRLSRSSKPGRTRRRWSTIAVTTVAVAGLAVSLSACAGDSAPKAPENKISQGVWPSYYPSDYGKIVDAAKKEGGTLTIYSNTDQENWAPIFRDFQKKYPFVTKIAANNLDSDEVFQKQLSETATGNAPADILVTNAVQAWTKYDAEPDRVLDYTSPELSSCPTSHRSCRTCTRCRWTRSAWPTTSSSWAATRPASRIWPRPSPPIRRSSRARSPRAT
ncbi:hypothetical protein [Microbacterium elymi]|uniref:Extracellular solute-binding protein n=1 Tax=Microbacterium elymi TaxID=2909587 RepID=A0ABY5NHI8_9MICO|nr:hypothetical protein [Microbacterium elymi]UUT34566.1 hypothetical protein L2X98_29020 [Microbacterium elymi]